MRGLLVALVSLLLSLGAIELGFRVLETVRESRVDVENQFIRATNVRRVFERAEVDGEDLYVRTDLHWIPRWPRFPAQKGADAFRVFCLGGSAAMGWPLPGEAAWSGRLEKALARLYPDRRIEVLNVAGNTYASYRVKIVFDEVVGYEPDVIVVYSGNNEFLESGVYRPPHLDVAGTAAERALAGRSALGRFVLDRLGRLGAAKRSFDFGEYSSRDMVSNRISFAFGRASEVRSDPQQLALVREHYLYNLESMVRAGRERGVPVVLATVPVNLRDWRPNASLPGVAGAARQRFLAAYREGFEALEARDAARAVSALERAVRLDPAYAEAWYDLGRAQLSLGRPEAARRSFHAALMRDAYPFRSIFDAELRALAARLGAPLADLAGALERRSEHGIPGFDQLLDYVHPTAEAHEHIAHEVLRTLAERGLLPDGAARRPAKVQPATSLPGALDWSAHQALFRQVLVMRQYEVVEAFGLRARRALMTRTGLSARERRWNQGALDQIDRSLEVVRPYRELLRAEKLGILDARFSPEEAQRIFDDYVALVRELEGEDLSDREFATYLPERTAE